MSYSPDSLKGGLYKGLSNYYKRLLRGDTRSLGYGSQGLLVNQLPTVLWVMPTNSWVITICAYR